jgi:(2R)-sulfolactate sulfo-lyase subunit alpha
MPNAAEPPDFLVHRAGDSVAVAVRDLSPGPVRGGYLSGGERVTLSLTEPVPLGHKFALREIGRGADVIEYGVRVAIATSDIAIGQHAHVHNLRSARWQRSVAS